MAGLPDGRRYSVVLVDDSRDIRALVRRRLERSGSFDVVGEGGNGDEAVSLVSRHEPDLLLLDASMPTADGIEALPAILVLSPETKVVVFTGFAERGLAARAREFGAADFVEKSIPLDELPERLLRTLRKAPPAAPVEARQRLHVVRGDPESGDAEADREVIDQHLEQFRELVDQATIGMATLTVTGTIVRANLALAEFMSCQPYDLVGVEYGRLTVGQGDRLDRALAALVSQGHDLATFEHLLPTASGDDVPRTVRVTLAPIRDSQGQALYVFAQVQDISAQRTAEGDLRRSEEHFRLLVSAVEEYAIFMLDVDGMVSSWNAGAQRIKGYAAQEIVGRSFETFYPPEEQASGHPQRNLDAALHHGTFAEEGWRVRKDGSRFWASVVISPVYDDAGRHIGFAKVTRDHTAQLRHDAERRSASAQQAHVLAVTAHELRNPTAVIDGSVGVLRESWDEMDVEERDELLAGIRSSAHRLRRLASDLATASRLQGETLDLELEEVSLTETLRRAASRRRIADTGMRVAVDVPDEVVLHADSERLAQALDNLLDNASRHGVPPVRLAGRLAGHEVRIGVMDDGPGVPEVLLPTLFQRFSIGGPSGGTGLGLYLVREIARGHGGDAAYLPPGPGQLTTFEMRLPRIAGD